MTGREYALLLTGIVFGLICGFRGGVIHGERNPNFETAEFNSITYPHLVNRCKSVWEAERFADAVMPIILDDVVNGTSPSQPEGK